MLLTASPRPACLPRQSSSRCVFRKRNTLPITSSARRRRIADHSLLPCKSRFSFDLPIMSEENFSEELRTRTLRQHDLSDTLVSLSVPLALSSPDVYRILLLSWYWIYKTIESKMEELRRCYPKVGAIYFPQLLRTSAFEDDLRYYYGSDFEQRITPPSKATADYIRNFEKCVDDNPVCLIAYCHTMYLAIFAGGSILKKWVRSGFNLPPGKGTKVFDFSDTISDVIKFRKEYNGAMNRIALSRDEKERIIATKMQIFEANNAIFAEIRGNSAYKSHVVFFIAKYTALFLVFLVMLGYLFESSLRKHVGDFVFDMFWRRRSFLNR